MDGLFNSEDACTLSGNSYFYSVFPVHINSFH